MNNKMFYRVRTYSGRTRFDLFKHVTIFVRLSPKGDRRYAVFIIKLYLHIQINHQRDAKIFHFTILTFIYSSTCFGRFSAHHQELDDCSDSLWFYLRIVVTVVLYSWSGRPDHEHSTTITTIRRLNRRLPLQLLSS
jgi:hypothetical protein